MNTLARTCLLSVLYGTLVTIADAASPTVFTYQGRLSDSGQAVTGLVDLRIRILDAEAGGELQAPEILLQGVQVTTGVFSVPLDFGAAPFVPGAPRWLEVLVRPTGSGTYAAISPRTAITSVPASMSTRGITVDAGGRVGINATTPGAMLDVRGTTGSGIYLQAGNGRTFEFSAPATVGSNVQIYAGTGGYGLSNSAQPGGAVEIRAGLGGSNAAGGGAGGGALFLTGGTGGKSAQGGPVIVEAGAGGNVSGFGNGGNGASLFLRGGAGGLPSGIGNNGQNGSVVVDRGNFGIGTTSPQNILHVVTDAVGSGWQIRMTNIAIASFQSGMRVSDSGFLEMTNQIGGANFARLSTTGVWTAVSDIRLKSDVHDADGLLRKALTLRPITYTMKGVSGTQLGFSAQQVDEVVPELVEHGSILTMDYSRMSVIAIGAIQEQEKELSRARSEIESMRTKNAELEGRLKKLEELLQAGRAPAANR